MSPDLGWRPAAWLRSLTGWRRAVAAIAAGGIATAALPPADILPALWVAVPAFIWLLDSARTWRGAFWIGWCFGFGYLAVGLYWLTFALFVDIGRYWWLVPFASNGLSAGLAIYWGGAGILAWLVPADRPVARAVAVAVALSLAEWLRGHLLTGFPWNLPGYAWTDFAWLGQTAAAIGVYGVTLPALLAPALAAPLGSPCISGRRATRAAIIGLAIPVVAAIAGFVRLPSQPAPTFPDVRLRLVQPSIAELAKADEAAFVRNVRQQLQLSTAPAEKPPNIIIWSEAAEPFQLDEAPDLAKALGAILPPDGLLITGTIRFVPIEAGGFSARNSLAVIDSTGRIVGRYDKSHLVPFGEYMPLSRWIPLQGIAAGDDSFGSGPGITTLPLPGLPSVSPLICYEVIFPHEVADERKRPQWLLDVTNDAWFGLTAGPHQHFAMMRARAIEEGLPLVNVANDGVSGVIDPYGRVVRELGLGAVGVIDSELPQPIAPTLYTRTGDLSFFAMLTIIALIPIAVRLRSGN